MKDIAFAIVASVALYGCTVSKSVEVTEPTDELLSCRQIENEIFRAESYEEKAREARGVTGTNVAAGLLFWPGLVVTQATASSATEAAVKRQQHLLTLAVEKECDITRFNVEEGIGADEEEDADADTTEQ